MRTGLRPGLPPLPARFAKLPLDPRGYPIPWFVAEVNGKRDFRVADSRKKMLALRTRLCWLCGEVLGRHLAFVIGPMCAINRNTSEPACHRECAEFAVRACPFLILPAAEYRRGALPAEGLSRPAHHLDGNPGAVCIWMTTSFEPYRVENGDVLIRLGAPLSISWYVGGKRAGREEIETALKRRLPLLERIAQEQGPEAEAELGRMVANARRVIFEGGDVEPALRFAASLEQPRQKGAA